MNGADSIVAVLERRGVTDVFGYPGGMVTGLMESLRKSRLVNAHVMRHEQGAAFAACGYAQATDRPGVAFATSGPGATNLVTGICHAWYDSVPTVFVTGQVNRSESSRSLALRQRGFQETDVVSMVAGVTKHAVYVDDPARLVPELEEAFEVAMSGRRGPVLLDVPMDLMRAEIRNVDPVAANSAGARIDGGAEEAAELVLSLLECSRRPCILLGSALKTKDLRQMARELNERMGIPVVTSMPAVDVPMPGFECFYGFIGAYGHRAANFVLAKSDLIISLGARLDVRQVGGNRSAFAPNARVVRVDVDADELAYGIREDDVNICANLRDVLPVLVRSARHCRHWDMWIDTCDEIRQSLSGLDEEPGNLALGKLSDSVPDGCPIAVDVGQNQVWAAQSFRFKPRQRMLFSASFGAMGYALPAAVGASCATGGPVVCITGDGGLQMNLQELEVIRNERLPVKVVVVNNASLGMIRHFQDMYFDGRHTLTTRESGWSCPDVEKLAYAYGLTYALVPGGEINPELLENGDPLMLEIPLPENTVVSPKLRFMSANQDQDPPLDRALYDRLMHLGGGRRLRYDQRRSHRYSLRRVAEGA